MSSFDGEPGRCACTLKSWGALEEVAMEGVQLCEKKFLATKAEQPGLQSRQAGHQRSAHFRSTH